MMKIPKVLQKNELGFCRVLKGTKKPFEKDWTNKPYPWKEIQKFNDENYGVLCGYGNLAVIDCDHELLQEHIERFLPKTFRVKTGSGGTHNYFYVNGLTKKIILWDKETHLGEIQSSGTQVVAPGSIHPNGKEYKITEDIEIREIELDELIDLVKPFMREFTIAEEVGRWEHKENSEIDQLNVQDVWGTAGLKNRKGEYYGAHPVHGSEGGSNFWMNPSKNLWHCFRCDSGGSALSAIAVKEGIINCSDAQKGVLRGDKAVQCINIAKEKYGLKEKPLTWQQKQYYSSLQAPESPKTERTDFELIWEKDLDNFQENKDWIIEKLIPQKSVGVWTGKRSTYKTFLVLNSCFCIASGLPFLDLKTRQGKVIYLDKENGIYIMRERKNMVKRGLGLEDFYDVGFICFSTLKIDKLTDIHKIEELIKENKPSVLVVDTYRRGISFEENDAGMVSKLFVDILRPLVEKYDLSIILIHHDRKGESQGDEMDMIRGSSDLANYVDFIIKNDRKGENTIILKQLKNRNAPEIRPINVGIETTPMMITFRNKGEYEKQSKDQTAAQIITDWIINNRVKTFQTKDVKEIAFKNGIKETNFKYALQNLQDDGIINKIFKGSYEVGQEFG